MAFRLRLLVLIALMLTAPLVARADMQRLNGTVNFHEDFSLPRGARLEVEIVDATDPAQRRVASILYAIEGRPPFRFSLGYDDGLAKRIRRHRMKASITLGELVLYREAEPTPVELGGEGAAPPEILLSPVTPPGGETSPLGKRWLLITINREKALGHARALIRLGEDGALSGSGGCNQISGGFELSEERLAFKRLSLSRRGCQSPVMQQERDFMRALKRTRSYRLESEVLTLLDQGGLELARLRQAFR